MIQKKFPKKRAHYKTIRKLWAILSASFLRRDIQQISRQNSFIVLAPGLTPQSSGNGRRLVSDRSRVKMLDKCRWTTVWVPIRVSLKKTFHEIIFTKKTFWFCDFMEPHSWNWRQDENFEINEITTHIPTCIHVHARMRTHTHSLFFCVLYMCM